MIEKVRLKLKRENSSELKSRMSSLRSPTKTTTQCVSQFATIHKRHISSPQPLAGRAGISHVMTGKLTAKKCRKLSDIGTVDSVVVSAESGSLSLSLCGLEV
jgi:hypothetical protein